MTKIQDEVLAANAKYAENFGDKGNLPLPPGRHFAILTCMDARLDPAVVCEQQHPTIRVVNHKPFSGAEELVRDHQ